MGFWEKAWKTEQTNSSNETAYLEEYESDALDGTPITDPDIITIDSPQCGIVSLLVNKRNAEKYRTNPKLFKDMKPLFKNMGNKRFAIKNNIRFSGPFIIDKDDIGFNIIDVISLTKLFSNDNNILYDDNNVTGNYNKVDDDAFSFFYNDKLTKTDIIMINFILDTTSKIIFVIIPKLAKKILKFLKN